MPKGLQMALMEALDFWTIFGDPQIEGKAILIKWRGRKYSIHIKSEE